MKKITLLFSMILMMCFSAQSQVQVGFGEITSQYFPFSPYHQYSYSQSIYLATEINASGTITSLSWYFAGTGNLANSQQLVVYLGTTDKSVFSSTTDWEPVTNLTPVYTGGITPGSAPGWINIPVNFTYDGTKNLIVAVDENQAGGDGFDDRFHNSAITGKRSIYFNSNTVNPDSAAPPTATNTAAYIPNVIFGGLTQACVTPTNLSSSTIGTATATVSWTYTGGHPSGGSDYYYSTSNVPPTSSTDPKGNVGGTSVALSGLSAGTKYYFWVRNNCGGDISSWSDMTSFTTACEAVAQFNENFDTTTTPNLPICWTKILRGDSISPAARVQTVPYNFNSSPNSLQLNNAGSKGDFDIIAVSPQVSNLAAKTHRLRFFAKGSNAIEVGTLSTNTNTAVFNVIQTISTLTTNYTQYAVDFSTYEGTDQYIGIRLNAAEQSTVNIDNVVWEFKPLCPDVTGVLVADVSYNSATIGWTQAGPEELWDVVIGSMTDTDPTLLTAHRTDVSGYYLAEGLDPTTKYKVWVRSVCPNGEGAYIGPVVFATTCEPLDAFFENFDSINIPKPASGPRQSEELPHCWTKIVRANSGVIQPGTTVYTSNDIMVMDSNSVNSCLLKNNNSTGNFDLMLVSPPISSLQLKNHRLRFFSRFAGSVEIGTLNTNTDSAIFTLFKTVTTTNAAGEYIVNFSTYNGTDTYIAFRLPNNAGLYGGFSIDNITWQKIPLCPEISNITVPLTTTSTATISWTPSVPGTETSWDVAWGDTSVTDPNLLTQHNVNASLQPTYTAADLISGTSYKVWVRAVCGGSKGNGEWIGPVIFVTECPPVAAFYENFDAVPIPTPYYTKQLPPCWTKILRGGTENLSQFASVQTGTIPWVGTVPNFTPPNYVYISPQGSTPLADVILVSPNVTNLGNAYRLKFDSWYPGTVEVGVLDGNTNAANFYVVKTVTLPGFTGGRTIVDFTNYSGPIREFSHIGIKVVGGNLDNCFFDNITWEPVPTCPDITTLTRVSLTSQTTALVKWQKQSTETGWEVSVHPNNPDATDAIHYTVNDPSPTTQLVQGLEPGKVYFVWIRTICGSTGIGAWDLPTKFVTPCLAVDIPYSLDFNDAGAPALTECTDASTDGIGSYWQTSGTAGNYGFSTKNIRCFPSGANTNAWFFTKGVNLVPGITYRISYLKGTSAPLPGGLCTGNCGGPVDFKVWFGNSPTIDGMTNILKDYPKLVGPAATDFVDFMVPTAGIYYFAFQNYSVGGAGDLSIDNILVNDASLGNDSFDLSQFNYYPNPVKDVLNISYSQDITAVSVYNLLGQKILEQSFNANQGTIDMSALTRGAYLVKINCNSQVKTVKVIKE